MAVQGIRAHLPIGKREKVPKRILLVKISFISRAIEPARQHLPVFCARFG